MGFALRMQVYPQNLVEVRFRRRRILRRQVTQEDEVATAVQYRPEGVAESPAAGRAVALVRDGPDPASVGIPQVQALPAEDRFRLRRHGDALLPGDVGAKRDIAFVVDGRNERGVERAAPRRRIPRKHHAGDLSLLIRQEEPLPQSDIVLARYVDAIRRSENPIENHVSQVVQDCRYGACKRYAPGRRSSPRRANREAAGRRERPYPPHC